MDISKCPGTGCFMKSTCWRYTSKPSGYQTYFVFAPTSLAEGKCEFYWNDSEYESDRKIPKEEQEATNGL